MNAPTPDEARAFLARLRSQGVAARLDDPVLIGEVLDGTADAYAQACRERDELAERLRAIRQTVFPLLRNPGSLGDLARTIDAEAEPQQHPAA